LRTIEDLADMKDARVSGSFAAAGYCLVAGLLSTERTAAMLRESTRLAPHARRACGNYYRVNRDGSVSSPRCMSTIEAGPVLSAIHDDTVHLEIIKSIVGRRLSPTRGSYIYYAPGDYIGLHRDALECEATLITCIAGVLSPLVVHTSLIGVASEDLVGISRAHSAMPPGGTRVSVPNEGRFLLLLGSRIPHHRPAALDSCVIATLCYA
jgi:hypothetical protein